VFYGGGDTLQFIIPAQHAVTRLDQHQLWPSLREYWYESLAHELFSKDSWIEKSADDKVQTPQQHAVYMFECEDQHTLITWYRASNLITVNNGKLYYMYQEYHHLFPVYAWLVASETPQPST
jgi:hypothetical protein